MDDNIAYKVSNRGEANPSDKKVCKIKKAPKIGAFFVLI